MNIGESIKYWRNKKNMTQKQLAGLAGISEISVRKYETNERKPKIDTLFKIAEALGVTIGDLDENYSYMRQDVNDAQLLVVQLEKFIEKIHFMDIPKEKKVELIKQAKELILKSHLFIDGTYTAIVRDKELKEKLQEKESLINDISNMEYELYEMFLTIMNELNYDGQEKVVKYAIDLTKIPEYRKETE